MTYSIERKENILYSFKKFITNKYIILKNTVFLMLYGFKVLKTDCKMLH